MEKTQAYIGKHLLVGLTYLDSKKIVVEHIQLHGLITRITKEGIFFDRADGKGEYALPPELALLDPATPGAEYRLRSTGEIVQNVDYVGRYTIEADEVERQNNR